MIPHRNQEAWQALRKDKRSALVVLLVIAAGVAAILALIGLLLGPSRANDRANPVYWALLLPFAWWAASLANYTLWTVNTLRFAAAVTVFTALLSLSLVASTRQDITPWVVAALVATPCAALGAVLYPNSLLAKPQR